MRVRGKLTANEEEQLRSMGQYNFGATLTNLILVTLAFVPILDTGEFVLHALRHESYETGRYLASVWIVCATLIALIVAAIILWRRKNFQRLIDAFPEEYLLGPTGISMSFTHAESVFVSWPDLREWWVRESLLLIARNDTLDPIVLPLGDLNKTEIGHLHAALQQNWKDETEASI